jgi:MFS family permease
VSAARGSPRIFYGWYIVAAGALCTFVGSGIGFYEVGVFIDPLTRAHGWSKGEVSFAITLLFACTGLIGVFVGRTLDQRGPRRIVIVGALAMSSALFLIGHLHALWQLYAVYLWMAVGYTCLSSIPVSWMVSRWFVRRRALALSISLAGTSTAGTVLVPLSQGLIDGAGLTATTNALAVLVLVVALPVGLLLVRGDPAEMGLLPDGDTPLPADRTVPPPRERAWGRAAALHTVAFWAITVAFSLALISQTAYLVHEIPYLKGPLGQQPAAFAVSMTAIAGVLGRFWVGMFAGRFSLRRLAITCFVVQSLALLVLALVQQPVVLFASTFVFGLTIGNVYMLQSLLTADCFGTRTYGTVYGLVSVVTLFSSAAGPSIASAAVAIAGGYSACFVVMAFSGLLAVVVVRYARPPVQRAPIAPLPSVDAHLLS